jgi:hypothetical protein
MDVSPTLRNSFAVLEFLPKGWELREGSYQTEDNARGASEEVAEATEHDVAVAHWTQFWQYGISDEERLRWMADWWH